MLGLESDPPRSDTNITPTSKPPLPKDNSKPKAQEQKGEQGLAVSLVRTVVAAESKSEPNIRKEERVFKRNPVL